MKSRIGIIGAGMAGLSCARRLSDAGLKVTIMEKSRGLGGRLATRRAEGGLQFDHGVQFVTTKEPGLQMLLDAARTADAVGNWQMEDCESLVGTPAMNSFAKFLAEGVTIRRNFHVDKIKWNTDAWTVSARDEVLMFDHIILTAPAPQCAALLGSEHPLSRKIESVRMLPCWTLMAAFSHPAPVSFRTRHTPDADLSWIALEV